MKVYKVIGKWIGVFILIMQIKLILTIQHDELENIDVTTEQTQEATFQIPDEKWIATALQDIAYFLRDHKFNEWDRRYVNNKLGINKIGYFDAFPVPQIKPLHWKVIENCDNNFFKCITYLHSIVETAPLLRDDDIVSILKKKSINNTQETSFDSECINARMNLEKSGLPFDSPLEKFNWRTSASYYMCWYTMLGIPALSMLGESCDNFANCFDPVFGHKNRDPRSDDTQSFACAKYSFCPDPCCPMKYIKRYSECSESGMNPCFLENSKEDSTNRYCKMLPKDNQNLNDIVLNRWNITCNCKEFGFVWRSQYGMCVDINECTTENNLCNTETEDCLNLPGTFKCICKYGFKLSNTTNRCVKSDAFTKFEGESNTSTFFDKLRTLINYLPWN